MTPEEIDKLDIPVLVDEHGKKYAICPNCFEKKKLGTAGIGNLKSQHLFSDTCKQARTRHDSKARLKSSTKKLKEKVPTTRKPAVTMSSWLSTGQASKPVPSTVAPPASLPSNSKKPRPATLVTPQNDAALPKPSPNVSAPLSVQNGNASEPYNLINEMSALIPLIPDSIPEATPYDPIAAFAGSPAALDDPSLPSDEIWEVFLNKYMKSALGWSTAEGPLNMDDFIRRGPSGMSALLNFVRYFVIKRDVSVGLFEGKLEGVMVSLRKCTVGQRRNSAPNDLEGSAMGVDSNATVPRVVPERNEASSIEVLSDSEPLEGPCPPSPRPATSASTSQKVKQIEVINVDSFEYEDTLKKSKPSTLSSTRASKSDSLRMCKGYALALPSSVPNSPQELYPHGLHLLSDLTLPWGYEVRNGMVTLFANSCPRIITGASPSCKACHLLSKNESVRNMLDRMEEGVHPNSRLAYHGVTALQEIVNQKQRQIDYLRLRSLNTAKKLLRAADGLDDHKRLLLAIASGKTHRIDRVISIGLRQRKGTRGLMASVLASAQGFYRPRGFTEEEDMKAILVWRLAGNRVADINHRATGAPSVPYLRRRSTIPPIVPSPSKPTVQQVQTNMESVFASILDLLRTKLNDIEVVHAILMFDELATEKRLRYDALTNMILGLCREHGHQTSLEFINEDDLKEIFRLLDEGKIHYASEATIAAVGLLDEDHRIYPSRPVLVSGDCKKETGPEHARIIQTVLDGVNALKEKTRIRIVSVASDGEARRGASLVQLTLKNVLDRSSPIYTLLSDLSFMDYHVGDDDITCDKDWKHVFKRLRNLLLRERGLVVNGIRITPNMLKDHMRAVNVSQEHLDAMFNPKDLQDVKLAVDLLKDVWNIPRETPDGALPGFAAAREAIWTLGKALHHLVFPYLCLDLSLSEQIEHLSAASHMFLSLYSKSGKHFIPTALYCDIQHMVKNAIFCVAKAKKDKPNSKFYLILMGTDRLEELFGILRTMIGNDANLDILQLVGRLAGTTEVANILAKYPHWDRGPRRLKCPVMSRTSTEILDSADHIKPGSWRGDVYVKNISLRTSWNRGRYLVESECGAMKTHLDMLSKTAAINILAPRGIALFKVPFDSDDVDESVDDEPTPTTPTTAPPEQSDSAACDTRVEVEDALIDPDVHSEDGPFAKTVMFGGKEVVKARALTLARKYRVYTSSTDRLRRVKEIDRYNMVDTGNDKQAAQPDVDSKLLVVSDPVASIASADDRFWLILGEVNTLKLDGRVVDGIKDSLLAERIATVSFQVLGLHPATVNDDPTSQHDWKTFRVPEKTLTVPGSLILPLNPSISTTHAAGVSPWYLFSSDSLAALAASLFEASREQADLQSSIPVVKTSSDFPYRNRRNEGCFVCGEGPNPQAGSLDCPRCVPNFKLPTGGQAVIAHIAAHIRNDPSIDRKKAHCGLCLQPASLCRYFLRKGKGSNANLIVDEKRSSGCAVKISWTYSSAAKLTKGSPCTNAPLICPLCPSDEPTVWRYFMEGHFQQHHPRAVEEYTHLWTLTDAEINFIDNEVWPKRLVIKKTRNTKGKRIPVLVSEAHRAQLPPSESNLIDKDGSGDQDGHEPELGTTADTYSAEETAGEDTTTPETAAESLHQRHESPDPPTLTELLAGFTGSRTESDEGIQAVAVDDVREDGREQCDDGGEHPRHLDHTLDSSVTSPNVQHIQLHDAKMDGNDTATGAQGDSSALNAITDAPLQVTGEDSLDKRRSTRKRNITAVTDTIRACTCGYIVDPSEDLIIECQAAGCEAHWYHLRCIEIPKEWPSKWYCDNCKDRQKGKGIKRPRMGVPK